MLFVANRQTYGQNIYRIDAHIKFCVLNTRRECDIVVNIGLLEYHFPSFVAVNLQENTPSFSSIFIQLLQSNKIFGNII